MSPLPKLGYNIVMLPRQPKGASVVSVPCPTSWRLEHQEVATGPGHLLVLARFPDLPAHF